MKKFLIISFLLVYGCTIREETVESLTITVDGKNVAEVSGKYGDGNAWRKYEKIYETLNATCNLAEFMKQSVSHSRLSSTNSSSDIRVTSRASLDLITTDFDAASRTNEAKAGIPHDLNYSAPREFIKALHSQFKMEQTATVFYLTVQYDEDSKKFQRESIKVDASASSVTCETRLDITSKRPD